MLSDYCQMIKSKLDGLGIRTEIIYQNERISKQIKNAEEDKIPFQLVIGKEEKLNQTISMRYHKIGSLKIGNDTSFALDRAIQIIQSCVSKSNNAPYEEPTVSNKDIYWKIFDV